jgi:5'-deoxynucleotidase YfbR-like HD superfamily hydrolase
MKQKTDYGYLREAFMVRRYHTTGHVSRDETVGHHTANVMAILFYLYDDGPPLLLLKAALHHDATELATGDIPATAKWAHPGLAEALLKAEKEVAADAVSYTRLSYLRICKIS